MSLYKFRWRPPVLVWIAYLAGAFVGEFNFPHVAVWISWILIGVAGWITQTDWLRR